MDHHTFRFSGKRGEIRYAWNLAASVTEWTIVNDRLTGTAVEVDAYRVTQRPLRFMVRRPHTVWEWPITQLEVTADGRFTATLGPSEGT